MSNLPRKKIYPLVGESQKNRDGTYRQAILQRAMPGEHIKLAREPDNEHDRNCVLAVNEEGCAIGSLSKEDAAIIAPLLDSGLKPTAFIHELTGGMRDYPNFGCVVSIVWEGRAKPEPKRLKGEQEFYEHAPLWETRSTRSESTKRKSASSGGFLQSLLKALLK